MNLVEVVGYPDSDKVGASARTADGSKPVVRVLLKRADGNVDYYEGEKID